VEGYIQNHEAEGYITVDQLRFANISSKMFFFLEQTVGVLDAAVI